ncbi:MAG TPA: hypothetical protein VK401_08180 [Propionibacteriaceae bacterium]|jgi:hypothetical protein|nr:hypothetical protein [Propionibacteriaceae bacterium]
MRSNPLDGPGMGYGPAAGFDRRGSPVVTVVLALVCLVLAATLAFVLLRPTGGLTAAPVVTVTATPAASAPSAAPAPSTAARSATPSPSVTPSGTDATERADEPEGVRDAVAAFMRAWLEREPDVRIPLLQVSATESLTEKLSDVDPRKIPKAKPAGKPVISAASDYSAVADQKLSDKSTVRMELVYDPASRYGWLVDSVGPLE